MIGVGLQIFRWSPCPLPLCLCLSLSLSLYFSPSSQPVSSRLYLFFVCAPHSLHLCVSVSLHSITLSLSLSLLFCVSLSLFSISLLCLSLSLYICVSLFFSLSPSLSLSLLSLLSLSLCLSMSLSLSLSLSLFFSTLALSASRWLGLSLSLSLSLSHSLSLFLSFSIWLSLSCEVPSGNLRHRPSYTLWLLPLFISLSVCFSHFCVHVDFLFLLSYHHWASFSLLSPPFFPLSLSLVSVSISIFSSFWWPLARCVSLLQTPSLSLFLSLSQWVYLVSLPMSLCASLLLSHFFLSVSFSALYPTRFEYLPLTSLYVLLCIDVSLSLSLSLSISLALSRSLARSLSLSLCASVYL